MKKFLLLSILFLSAATFGQTQNTWTKKTSFSGLKRARAVAFVVEDYGYVGMGEDTAEMPHNDLWRYDPLLDVWSQMMSLPGSVRRNATATAIGDKGYVGMGADSSISTTGSILDDWWEYDPLSNNWTQKASYPGGYDIFNNTSANGIYFATAFSIGDKAYVCGGKMSSDFYGTDLWEYDPNLDTWTRKADFPGGDRYQLSSFAVDGKGYVGLGIDHDLFRKDWWQYDPDLDTWTEASSLPGVARGAASTFVLGQRGYVVFGSDGGYKDELWEYNPFSDSWNIKANFPADGRKNAIAFAIGNKGYAGLGKGASGKRKSFYEYSPLLPVGNDELVMESISVYPNPALEDVKISSLNKEISAISVYSLDGRMLFNQFHNGTTILNRGLFGTGTFIVLAKDEQGNILATEKLIYL
ncbi:MAG: T9SS type A sorting domain-containing protein [Crocinitomicaceae bacterium]